MNPKTTLRGLILATLLITLPGAYAAPNKTAPAKTPAAKTAPAKPAAAKKTAAKTPAKPADNKKNAAKTPAKPADNKKTAAKTPANPADNKKTAAKTPAKPADNKKTAAAKTPAKPADNKKTAAKTPAKPADNKKTAAASTKPAAKPAAAPAKKTNTCGDERLAALSAAREGKLDALKKYSDKKCPLNITDTSGLTPYDLATLNGHKNISDWLVQNKHAQKNQHSSAYTKTLQTGLNFLGYNAGPANGKPSAATTNAIKAYQKANGLSANGKTDASWLPGFNSQINKKLQQKLRAQGYDTGGSKGIIGAKTQNAIQEYRKKHKLGSNDNPQDSQLLAQLMNGDKPAAKTKETAAKRPPATIAAPERDNSRDAEQRATEAAEQQQAEAIARRQAEEAQRPPQIPLAPPPVAIDRNAANQATANLERQVEAERQASLARQEAERRRLVAEQATRQAEAQRRAEAAQLNAELARQTAERQSAERLAAEQAAQKAEAERARFRAEAQRRAEEIAREQSAAVRPAASAPVLAQNTPRPAPATTAAVATAPTTALNKPHGKTRFNRISGSLNMSGNGSLVSNCAIGGQNIDPGWCQQYYPDGSGKQCNAVISGSGSVVSLTCK
ncbi:peptidoglycan-binding protein [Cardiobacterium hominis]|uniref:peptidoglycan-binding protein n=1 Tax=Cardiobacterium hominis TaxID=2718 RepID=UPI00069D814E|nr:peptidoglycan-binding protein [Cardiobacterium hominis]